MFFISPNSDVSLVIYISRDYSPDFLVSPFTFDMEVYEIILQNKKHRSQQKGRWPNSNKASHLAGKRSSPGSFKEHRGTARFLAFSPRL